ncbi:MAG: glycosyltransferase family 2 protein, partial [Planctomycetota bacterium]
PQPGGHDHTTPPKPRDSHPSALPEPLPELPEFPGAGAGVAILTPGRDEAEHLPTVLPELCEQDVPELTVVFIDDASTDATPTITAGLTAKHDNLIVVRNDQEPPPGWMGKCWAIHRGYEVLRKQTATQATPIEWLCFTDADIHWHPRLLRTALEHAHEHDADLLGVTPTLRFGSVGEAVVQLQLVLALGVMFPFEKAMDPDSPIALTGGAFILVRRSFYDEIGGHAAVKGEMVEDLKLGMALKAAGARHRVAMAGALQWCRMYDGPADMWEGLTKNAYAGLGHRWWAAAGLLVATGLLNVSPALIAVGSGVALMFQPDAGWMSWATLGLSALTVIWQARALNTARKLMDLPWAYAWTMPIGSAAYAVILAASVLHYHTKGNAWKGRRYTAADTQTD